MLSPLSPPDYPDVCCVSPPPSCGISVMGQSRTKRAGECKSPRRCFAPPQPPTLDAFPVSPSPPLQAAAPATRGASLRPPGVCRGPEFLLVFISSSSLLYSRPGHSLGKTPVGAQPQPSSPPVGSGQSHLLSGPQVAHAPGPTPFPNPHWRTTLWTECAGDIRSHSMGWLGPSFQKRHKTEAALVPLSVICEWSPRIPAPDRRGGGRVCVCVLRPAAYQVSIYII